MDEDRLKRFQDNGLFSPSGTDPTSPISLGILLTSCHFWNSKKICSFLETSWDNMKDRKNDKEMNDLKESLRSKSEDAIPVDKDEGPNWTKVLGSDWDILKLEGTYSKNRGKNPKIKSGDVNSKSVVELLRLIRNKYSHYDDLTKEELIDIGWCNNEEKFDENAFVTYWTHRFPKLIPFLWLKLFKSVIHEKLTTYYSYSLQPHHIEFMSKQQLDLDIYIDLLYAALLDHLEKGGLAKRFHHPDPAGKVTHLLEFRTLPHDVIQTALTDNSSVIMHVRHNRVCITWYKIDTTSDELNVTSSLEYPLQKPNPFGKKTTTLIIVHTVHDKFFTEECADSSRVIIFFSEIVNHMNLVANNFSNIFKVSLAPDPLKWMDLSDKTKLRLEEGEVNFQNKITKIKDILPQNDSKVMFALLQGNDLMNELLTEGKPIVFDKHELPKISNTYIERKLFKTCMVTSKVLRHRETDIFVVTNIEPELLQTKVNPEDKIQLIEDLDTFMSGKNDMSVRIYYTFRCELRKVVKILDSNPNKHKYKIHFLRYVEDELFEWLGTFGSHSIIKKSFAKIPDNEYALNEETFLGKIMHEPIAPIFIADKPGMGKSLLLASLSNIICKNFKKSFVLHFPIKDFVDKIYTVSNEKLEKQHIESVIVDTLCTTTFEKYVVAFWLQQSNVTASSIKFELMLDGLDEVEKEEKNLALKVLKLIHHEFNNIRLWVTLREHMMEELEDYFSVIVHKILPFTENDKISFLEDHWGSKKNKSLYSSQELFQLAHTCVTGLMSKGIETEIAGAPLQCRMLAEIYENNLSAILDGKNEYFTLTKKYEGMIEKKLRECLKEKQLKERYVSIIRKEMQNNHMYLAIKLLFSERTSDLFCEPLGITSEDKEEMESTVKGEGIIQNIKPLSFIHRTFAEYFVALFIFKVLTGDAKLALDVKSEEFQNFFMNEVLEVSSSKQQLSEGKFICKFKFPVLCYFLNAMLDNQNIHYTAMESMIMKAQDFQQNFFESHKSVIFATLQGTYFNLAKLVIDSLSMSNMNYFMERTSDMPAFLLETSLRCTDVNFFKYICSTIEAWYKSNHNDDHYIIPESIFKLALGKGKYEIAKFLIETKGFDQERWAIMRENDRKRKYGIIHWIMIKSRHDEDEVLTDKKKLLQFIFDIDPSLVEQTDVEGETPLFLPPSVNIALKKFLITDLHANVNATGNYKNTPFHWKDNSLYKKCFTPEGYHELLETFIENQFNQINLYNQRGSTPLHCAIKTFEHALHRRTLELFRLAGADFNAKDDNGKGNTVLHFCIRRKCPIEFILNLIDCGSKKNVKTSKGLSPLELARETKYFALEEILAEGEQ